MTADITHPDSVLIIDFGSQVTQLIARRVREAGVYCEIAPFQSAEEAFKRLAPKAVILSGSPASTVDIGSPRAPQVIFDSGLPVLGICYGEQTMCAQLGGKVEGSDHREFGRAFLEIENDCPLFEGVWAKGTRHQVWMSHGDRVTAIPPGFRVVGTSTGTFALRDDTDGFAMELAHDAPVLATQPCWLTTGSLPQGNNTSTPLTGAAVWVTAAGVAVGLPSRAVLLPREGRFILHGSPPFVLAATDSRIYCLGGT